MQTVWTRRLVALSTVLGFYASPAWAQDDRLATCPDPAAARKYVNECLQQNPYNTREICEERALEKLCQKR